MSSKKLLIIYPHWVPSNLAGVHRPRLIANFAHEFNWHPIILTVDEKYYEEPLDRDMEKLVHSSVEVYKVKALPVLTFPFKIGDIGLRGFYFLYKKALQIIKQNDICFIWIPIPSFYTALLGRILFEKTQIPYGIDYIDPWVSQLAPYQKKYSKAWWVSQFAKKLEPIAVKKASLISGVSTPYYMPVIERNFKNNSIAHVGMPYGFDPNDHTINLDNIKYPWDSEKKVKPIVYAGAFLPQSHLFIEAIFKSIRKLRENGQFDNQIRFYFLGTGFYAGKKISQYAKEERITDIVIEIQERFPFLHILNFLSNAYRVMVIGSTEKHYTASKTFQALLSKRPVFSIFHHESTATQFLNKANADTYLVNYFEGDNIKELVVKITPILYKYLIADCFWLPNYFVLDEFSSKNSAQLLLNKIDSIPNLK